MEKPQLSLQTSISGSDKIGEIVTNFPGTRSVFKEYQIDFCCGGDRPLETALQEQDLNESEVLSKLQFKIQEDAKQLEETSRNWKEAAYSDLIDYVVQTHHVYLQRGLPELSDLVTKILRVHGAHHGATLSKLHKLYHSLKMELEQHLIKEEEIVFPLIKQYEKNQSAAALEQAVQAIQELESEHSEAGSLLKEMREITDHYKLPEDACRTYTLTFQKLEHLESDLFEHIHLENNILFPRLEAEYS